MKYKRTMRLPRHYIVPTFLVLTHATGCSQAVDGLKVNPDYDLFQVVVMIIMSAVLIWIVQRITKVHLLQKDRKFPGADPRFSEQLHYLLAEDEVNNYFNATVNNSFSEDELLWDVVKKCIARLNFEDCVIYLLDPETQMLVQSAACGPKNYTNELAKESILSPLSIPVGEGIVGTVAKNKIGEIVNDVSRDPRYIVDDARRCSEICVPIVYDGKVIGVIDSESTQKNFFTQRHLQILTTVAAHCAARIVKLRAEQKLYENEIRLLQAEKQLSEERLVALRSQMNPHFIFNCLNSIQQFIFLGDTDNANRFLSKFSRLIRMVLQKSETNFVTLAEELEMLELYLSLEKTRFADSFHYQIKCDAALDQEEIKIPNLLVQPFVENAIWHGLLHKPDDRALSIQFLDRGDQFIDCIILDNGIGRAQSVEIQKAHSIQTRHESKGMKLIEKKMAALSHQFGQDVHISIIDLVCTDGSAGGTKVEIRIPTCWMD